MNGCEMDNGESFALDDISDGFFPQETGADGSDFNWADDFLSSAEGQEPISSSTATQHQTIGIGHTNAAQQITQNAPVVSGQYVISNPVAQLQVTNTGQGIQFVQPIQNVATAGTIPNLIGSGATLVRGPNGQLMLKTINTNNLQVQQAPQAIVQNIAPAAQGHQTLFQQNQASVLPTNQGQSTLQQLQSTVLNRSVTPSHPSPSASPIISRSQTPASSPHINSRSMTPSQTSTVSQGQGQQQVLGNIATGQTNLNVFQIPGNTQSPLLAARGIQLQGISPASSISGGSVNLQGQTLQGLVQTSQGQTYVQGQGQTAVLQGQGQNIVNTQNTVIQNPNVVNLNVAHVLCNPNLQNQGGQSVQQLAPGVQGTLIQLADGKNIIIPSQNVQPGQSVNLQQLIQPQLNVAQTSTANNPGLLQGATVLGGNVVGGLGNIIRLAPSQTAGQEKTNNTATAGTPATHFIGVNQQGQQVLIQRAPTPNTHQNIVVRALAPQNVLQIQQPAGSSGTVATSSQYQQNIITLQNPLQVQQGSVSGNPIQVQQSSATGNPLQVQQPTASGNPIQVQQPIASVNVATATSQSQYQTATGGQLTQQQQLVMASQQQGIRIVTGPQGQQFKIVGQPGAIPMTLNLQNLQGNQTQAIQLLQQPQQQVASQSDDAQRVPSVSQTMPVSSFAATSIGTTIQRQSIQQSSDGTFQLSNTGQVFGQTVIQAKTLPSSVQSLQPVLSTQSPYLMKTQKISSSTVSLSTACSTVVTSTLTSSQASSISSLIVNGQTQVISSPLAGQSTLQARNSAPRLKTSTVQLPPELKKKLNMVQAEIVKIASIRGPLSQEMREKSRALLDLRKKILAQGQSVPGSTEQAVPINTVQQLLTSKRVEEGMQASAQNQPAASQSQHQGILGQGQQVINQTLITVPQNQTSGGQLGSQVIGQQVQGQVQIQQFPGQVVSQPSVVSSIPVQGALRVSVAPTSVSLSNTVQVSPSMTFGGTMTTVQQSDSTNLSALGNLVANSQGSTATSSQGSIGGSQITGTTPMVHTTTGSTGNLPNVVTQAAVPTQIKIGNHILNLNLTPAQKEKVEGYLSKMSPEQQQQQISMFLKLQQQQQLQAQVQAQVKAQQSKILIQQQGKTVVQTSSTNIPITVQAGQKVVDAGQTVIINTPGKPQMMIKRVSVASIPKSQLILQQLHKDQENALKPDTKTPYRSRRDTYRRLLRYHVYQSKHPPKDAIDKDEETFENMAVGLTRKSDFLYEKFRILMMKESMRERQTAEMVMIQRLLNEDLKDTLQSEKKMAAEDPDLFEPLPMEVLLRKTTDTVKEEIKTEPESAIKQELIEDSEVGSINSPSIHNIKTEENSSRPSTPKVKLVIRNDGQSFSSSLRESLSSDTEDDSSQGQNVLMGNHGDEIDVEMTDCTSPLLSSIKNEPIDVDEHVDRTADWSDISAEEKPFSQYMDTHMDGQSNQDTYVDIDGETLQNDHVKVESMSEELQSNYGTVNEESDQAVQSLLTTDNYQSYQTIDSFHSHEDAKPFSGHLPFSANIHTQAEQTSNNIINSRKVKSMHNENDSLNDGISFSQDSISLPASDGMSANDSMQNMSQSSAAHYEPISSPEGDNEDDFFTHKLDLSYSVGGHKLDFGPSSGLSSQSMSQASKETSSGVIEVTNDDGTTSDSSDDSTDDDDDDDIEGPTTSHDDRHLNSQMQSAIDSILSLNNDSSENLQTHYSSQSQHFTQPEYESSQSGNSAINSPQTEENDNFSMDDDLDAAVKSILM